MFLTLTRLKIYFLPLFFLLLFSLPAEAAVITLVNGDQLSGKIIIDNNESLTLHHAILGDITIPKKEITEISESKSSKRGNDKIDAKAAAKTDTSEAKAKPAATEAKVKASELSNKPVKTSSRLPGLFGLGFLEGWKHRLAFGIKGEEGNDVSMDLSVAFNTSFKDDSHRFSLESAYYYETDEREKDTSKGHINIVRDWLLPHSDWFFYGYGRYEYDAFKSWEHRVSISSGPGYDFYKDNDLRLTGRAGLGISKSWGTENDFDFEGQLGLEWVWKPETLKKQAISSQIIIYPILNDPGEYRAWMEGKWRFDIDLYRGLGFEIGFEYDYESDGEKDIEDEKSYDLLYFGRLGLDF